jgi:DUF4097 and DUF4098 domain-containing protein YvlB
LRLQRFVPLLGLGCALLTACIGSYGGSRVSEATTQNVALSGPATLRVDNTAGTVHVAAWNNPQVAIVAKKFAPSRDDLKNIVIDVVHSGSSVIVTTRYLQTLSHGTVDYTISVPTASSVRVNNTAGLVSVDGVGGNVNVRSEAGSVSATLPRVDANRSVTLHATTGTVTLTIPKDSNATVHAVSTVGSFSSDFPITSSSNNVVGVTADGRIGSGSGNIDLSTTTGAIGLHTSP